MAFGGEAVFLEAAVGFVREGVFDEAGPQKTGDQFIHVSRGLVFAEIPG